MSLVVFPERREVLLKPNQIVLDTIPTAECFEYKGKQLVRVPHSTEECLVLRNLGYAFEPPIKHYYDWPGRHRPRTHQYETAGFLTSYRRALVLSAPGTGKTLACLWAADYLLREGVVKKVAIIAPLSTLQVVWGKELIHHFPHRQFEIIVGTKQRQIERLKRPNVDIVVINHDGFTQRHMHMDDIDLVIYDEATAVKNPSTRRFRTLWKWLAQHDVWLWMLTGTPIAQSPLDAFALAKLIGSKNLTCSYTTFRERVMRKVTQFKWVPRPEAPAICHHILQPSIRYTLEDCVDIPPMNYIDRQCSLTETQRAAFKEMQKDATVLAHNIAAPNAAVLLGKLLQICLGVAYDVAGNHVVFDAGDRYAALKSLIEEVGDKVIVYVPLRGAQDHLVKALAADGYDVANVHGGVGKTERNDIFNAFQDTDRVQVLVAHPKVAAHGLTLTRAKAIIWYAPIYSLEQYEQANARIRRLNTDGKRTVFHLYATTFEAEMYSRLKNKQQVLSEFLSLADGVHEGD